MVAIFYDQLPHWVVDYGRYAVTLRCAGSLPKDVIARLQEITDALREIEPASEDAAAFRRRQFAILESYLDQGHGFAPFADSAAAQCLGNFLRDYDSDGLRFSDWVVMPNHVHILTEPVVFGDGKAFQQAWRGFKGRSARTLREWNTRKQGFWQPSWYDRWIRDAAEYERWQRYLASNPVKAGICERPDDFEFLVLS